MQQRVISIDDTALLCSEGSENVFLGVFESLGEISPLILRIKPSIAVIDPVNGSGAGWISQRRLASDLFEVIGTAERISVWLILLCEMMDWNGDSRPRLYSTLRKFCDHEMEVQTSRQL